MHILINRNFLSDFMNVLMSIKPEFVNRILTGEKQYEFRKSIFKENVERIYIYSSYPVKKIVGYFEVDEIIHKSPEELWNSYSDVSGISKKDFFEYFKDREKGYAIKINNLKVFDEFIEMKDYTGPQSFCYIENSDYLMKLLLI